MKIVNGHIYKQNVDFIFVETSIHGDYGFFNCKPILEYFGEEIEDVAIKYCRENKFEIGDYFAFKKNEINKKFNKKIINGVLYNEVGSPTTYSNILKCLDNVFKHLSEAGSNSIAIPVVGIHEGSLSLRCVYNTINKAYNVYSNDINLVMVSSDYNIVSELRAFENL